MPTNGKSLNDLYAHLDHLDTIKVQSEERTPEFLLDRLFSEPLPVRLTLSEFHTFLTDDRYLARWMTSRTCGVSMDDIRDREPTSWVDVTSRHCVAACGEREVAITSYEIHLGDASPKPDPLPLAKCEAYVVPADGSAPFTMDIKSFTLEIK
jgi:hypothetical protein